MRTWTLFRTELMPVGPDGGRGSPEPITIVMDRNVGLDVGDSVKVVELEPVLALVKALADALECCEDVEDPLHDAADAAILDEADALLEAHGRPR